MLYIFCAMRCEAEPLIDKLTLSLRMKSPGGIDIYCNDDTILAITGMGPVNASYAAGVVFALFPPCDEPVILNVGICAGRETGHVYLVDKITDDDSGRQYYPDILYDTGMDTSELATVSRVINDGLSDNRLYDMEGASIYYAASRHTSPDRICLIKVVSDSGEGSSVTAETARGLIASSLSDILKAVEIYRAASRNSLTDVSDADVEETAALFNCSETMRYEIRQLIRYAVASDRDHRAIISQMISEGSLPADNRRTGKEMLNEFRRRVLY